MASNFGHTNTPQWVIADLTVKEKRKKKKKACQLAAAEGNCDWDKKLKFISAARTNVSEASDGDTSWCNSHRLQQKQEEAEQRQVLREVLQIF